MLRSLAIEGADDGLGPLRRLVNGAVAVIHDLFRMPQSPLCIGTSTLVPRIGRGSRVAGGQTLRQSRSVARGPAGVDDAPRESSIANTQVFFIPARRGQPHLKLDVRIARRLDHSLH